MNIRKIYIIFIFFSIFSCGDPSYEISRDHIRRSELIKDGFHLIEIFVTESNDAGRPIKYSDGESVFCGPTKDFSGYIGEKVYNQKEKILISESHKIMDTIMTLNGNSLGGEGHDIRIMEYLEHKNLIDSIINVNFPFDAQREINFFEKNENYKWVFTKNGVADLKFYDYSRKVFDTLPMNLKKNQWYLLNFSNTSNIVDKVFFRINENGEIEQHNYYHHKWGV